MGNIKTINLKPYFDPKKNISFGGKLETEMFEKFNCLDIIWYAPEKSEQLEKWKAFSNVEVYKAINEKELSEYQFYNKNTDIIKIMTGKYAEELFTKNEKREKCSSEIILIYCMNSKYHKTWSQNYDEIKIVTTKPNEIFDFLLKFQNNIFPLNRMYLFNYKIIDIKKYNFNYFKNVETNELIFDDFSLKLNPYEKNCLNTMATFILLSIMPSKNEMFFDFRCCFSKIINLFYGETIDDFPYSTYQKFFLLTNSQKNIDEPPKELLIFLTALLSLSLYFSKFPYFYGCLNYKEIEKQLKEKITKDILRKKYHDIFDSVAIFHKNIITNQIMDLTQQQDTLKKLHYFLIDFIKFQTEFNEYSRYPILIRYLMDIDFCLKYFFDIIFELIGFEKYKKNKWLFKISFLYVDKRISFFKTYINMNSIEKEVLQIMSKEELIKLNNAIKIKDFIVIGNKGFHQKIKNFEKNLSYQKIDYLKISELTNFLKKEMKENEDRKFRYFFIIEIEEMQRNYKEIYSIIKMFALILHIIIYSKDEKVFINKISFQIPYMPIFLANSMEEIINYVKSQEFINCGFNLTSNLNETISSLLTNEIKNVEIDELFVEDGWELSENIPKKIFEKIVFENCWDDNIGQMKRNFLKMLKDNNIGEKEEIKYKYANYFSFKSFPESVDLIDIVIKHFLYAYSRSEKKNSFYYILNKELRSGDSKKTHKYLELVSIINTALEKKSIKSYKGELYRATYIQNDIINKILVEGKIVINFAFMSSTKSRKVAEKFLSQPNKNVLFIIETNENNIDIELECISQYQNEKEVLFIPYSKFSVIKNEKKNFMIEKGNIKEIYEITLKGLDFNHERKNIIKCPFSEEIIKIMFESIE